MKKVLLFTVCLALGFTLAVATPLGKLAGPSQIHQLISTLNPLGFLDGSRTKAPRSLVQFQSLIASAAIDPGQPILQKGNILQNREIVVAAGFIDPEDAWAMNLNELGRADGMTRASLDSSIVAPDELKRGEAGGGNIGQGAPNLAMPDAKVWRSQTTELEIDRLHATISDIEAENRAIRTALGKTEKTHPDYHMLLCVEASNRGLIAFYTFLVKMGEEGATTADTDTLSATLTSEKSAVAGHVRSGRTTAAAYRKVLDGLAAHDGEEENIKSLALEYYDSFLLSFDVEETLAAHLTAYPDLIAEAIETGEPPYGVSAWVDSFQELGRSRMELQAYRQTITQELAGPTA